MENKTPVQIEDGKIVIENRLFRIAGRLLAFAVIVVYLTLYFQARKNGEEFEWTTFDIGILSVSAIAVFAVEYLRYLAKKKIG